MLLVDGEKYACIRCIRGHRSSTCKHKERPLVQVRKRGRPASDCNHRLAVLPDGTCECGIAAIILPKGAYGSEFREIEGGKRQILDTSKKIKYEIESNTATPEHTHAVHRLASPHQYGDNSIRLHTDFDGIVSDSPRPQNLPRVIYDHSRVVIQQVEAPQTSQAGSVCDDIQKTITNRSCCNESTASEEAGPPSTTSVSVSSSSTSISSINSESDSSISKPVKLRSIVVKPDDNSPAIVRPLDIGLHSQTPARLVHRAPPRDVTQQPLYHQNDSSVSATESLDTDTDYSNSSPAVFLDQALHSVETYLATSLSQSNNSSSQPYPPPYPTVSQQDIKSTTYSANSLGQQQPFTLTPSQVEDLTRYSSRTGVVSYPIAGMPFSNASPVSFDVSRDKLCIPSGSDVSTSQKTDISQHLEMLSQEHEHIATVVPHSQQRPMPTSADAEEFAGEDFELLDNLFSVYLTSACAVPGEECYCTDNCSCLGCTKHGNRAIDGEGNGGDDLDIFI
ncbi:hypothetical protein V1525DRAFT_392335 [Lipomyces kononenkoae]|uniref:Uncharacterized protein n=1 Tax=Lipomyces kononenkoae TaxID=34357 RepID=A0ACC3TB57_LIPKO